MISLMIEIWLLLVSIHLRVNANSYQGTKHGHDRGHMYRFRNQPSHRHHQYNRNHLNHQHIQPYAAKASDYDLLIAQQELRDILRAQHQYIEYDEEWDEMDPTSAWLKAAANNPVPDDEQMFVLVAAEVNGRNIIKVKWPTALGGDLADDAVLFKWDEYKEKVDENLLNAAQKLSVYGPNGLRKQTQIQLLTWSVHQNGLQFGNELKPIAEAMAHDAFYNEMGSLTSTSDLDFSYIRWDHPEKIVKIQVDFYNKHFEIIGLWPLEAFDMNFYGVTGFVKDERFTRCWWRLAHAQSAYEHANVRALFDKVWDNEQQEENHKALYEFAGQYHGDKADRYKAHDSYMAYLLIQVRFKEGLTKGTPVTRIIRMVKYSEILYYIVNDVKHKPQLIRNGANNNAAINPENLNFMKLYLKTLRYIVNYWSDEAYFSNQALQLIMGAGKLPNEGIYLAMLDNLAFIHHYYEEIKKSEDSEINKLLKFWNKASKYIYRTGRFVDKLDRKKHDPSIPGPIFNQLTTREEPAWLSAPNFAIGNPDTTDIRGFYADLMKEMPKFNLYKLAERWVRKWNERANNGNFLYGDGEKKIRGDISAIYFETELHEVANNKQIERWREPIPGDAFSQRAIHEARAIWWKLSRSMFIARRAKKDEKPIDMLYDIMCGQKTGLRGFIEINFFEKAVKKGYKEAMTKIYESVANLHTEMNDKVKMRTIQGTTQKQIRYNPMNLQNDEELIKKVTHNPFVDFQKDLGL